MPGFELGAAWWECFYTSNEFVVMLSFRFVTKFVAFSFFMGFILSSQVNNRVYDCTEFLRLHPGGADSILINAGTDSSEEFDAIHSLKAWKMLDKYYIGQLRPG